MLENYCDIIAIYCIILNYREIIAIIEKSIIAQGWLWYWIELKDRSYLWPISLLYHFNGSSPVNPKNLMILKWSSLYSMVRHSYDLWVVIEPMSFFLPDSDSASSYWPSSSFYAPLPVEQMSVKDSSKSWSLIPASYQTWGLGCSLCASSKSSTPPAQPSFTSLNWPLKSRDDNWHPQEKVYRVAQACWLLGCSSMHRPQSSMASSNLSYDSCSWALRK